MDNKTYMALQDAYVQITDLKVGDSVKIIAVAKYGGMGWEDSFPYEFDEDWLSDQEDNNNMNEFVVDSIDSDGIKVIYPDNGESYSLPFYTIEKLDVPSMAIVKIDYSGDVHITAEEVRLNNSEYDIEDFRKIVKAFIKLHDN